MKILSISCAAVMAIASCNNVQTNKPDSDPTLDSTKVQVDATDVPFVVAERYFVKNTVTDSLANPKIAAQEEFDKIFGPAATMGKDGRPTEIDFSKQFVVAVVGDKTNLKTTLEPISLQQISPDTIVFTYKKDVGEKQSYTIVPALAIVVDKSFEANVVLKETP